MTERDYKQIANDAARIIQGLVKSVQKRGGGHYSCINPEYVDFSKQTENQIRTGNYLADAYRWLFDNCGLYWKGYISFLTPEQQKKLKNVGG